MTISLEDAYTVEQLTLAAFSISAFGLFCAQWQGEAAPARGKGKGKSRGSVKHRLHRVGLLVSVLMCAVAMDPYGVRNVLPPLAVSWIGANLTALFVASLAFLNQTAVEVVYLARLRKVPAALGAVTWLLVSALVVVANVSYYLVLRSGHWWFTAIDLLFSAAVLLAVTVSFIITAFKIVGALDSGNSSRNLNRTDSYAARAQRRNTKKRSQMIWRTVTLTLIACAVVPLQVLSAVERLRDRTAGVDEPDLDRFDLRDRAFIYGHVVATLLLLWYSWEPAVDKKKAGYRPIDTFDSRSRTASNSRSRRSGSDLSAVDEPSTSWKSATHRRLRGEDPAGGGGGGRRRVDSDDEYDGMVVEEPITD